MGQKRKATAMVLLNMELKELARKNELLKSQVAALRGRLHSLHQYRQEDCACDTCLLLNDTAAVAREHDEKVRADEREKIARHYLSEADRSAKEGDYLAEGWYRQLADAIRRGE